MRCDHTIASWAGRREPRDDIERLLGQVRPADAQQRTAISLAWRAAERTGNGRL